MLGVSAHFNKLSMTNRNKGWQSGQTFDIGNIDIERVIPGTAPTAATRVRPQLARRELMREDFPVLGKPVTLTN
jgi:hypothetical protein